MQTSFRPDSSDRAAGDARSRILAATLTLVLAHGMRKLRSADVARAANTTESTVFRYYRSIDELLQATYDLCWGQINEHMRRSNYDDLRPQDALGQLLATFDYLWAMHEDDELSQYALMAFTFYRRPRELEADGKPYESGEQAVFERRIEQMCSLVTAQKDSAADATMLQKLVTNFAATVWLTWELIPDAEDHLSTDEARLGILGLVEKLVSRKEALA